MKSSRKINGTFNLLICIRYKEDYSFREQSNYESQQSKNIPKIEVYLGQDDHYLPTPQTTKSKPVGKTFSIHGNKIRNKKKINMKYFTSNLDELPGPVTPQMREVAVPRKNQSVHKRYDNNLRKVLYQSSYQRVNSYSYFIGRKRRKI
jgi:hypothetical protein